MPYAVSLVILKEMPVSGHVNLRNIYTLLAWRHCYQRNVFRLMEVIEKDSPVMLSLYHVAISRLYTFATKLGTLNQTCIHKHLS